MKSFWIFALFVCCVAADGGGWEIVETIDEETKDISRYAAEYVNGQLKSNYHHKLFQILLARRQVVAGEKYEVILDIRETKCRKDDHTFEEAAHCELKSFNLAQFCTVTVWDKPWEHFREVESFECEPVSIN